MAYQTFNIDPSMLSLMFTGFQTKFLEDYGSCPVLYEKIATVVNSTTAQEQYGISLGTTRMTEWTDERQVDHLAMYQQTIVNKVYQAAIEVNRFMLSDTIACGGSLGQFELQIKELANAAKKWGDTLVTQALLSGTSTRVYDGQFFFDAAHLTNPGLSASSTASNLHSARPLTAANYDFVRSQRAGRVGADGRPLCAGSNLLIVPPQLEGVARSILQSDFIAPTQIAAGAPAGSNVGSATNIWKGTADILVLPELAAEPLNWYLADASGPIKPIILQKRAEPEFYKLDQMENDHVFKTGNHLYGCHIRGGVGYSRWTLIDKALG